MKKMLVITSVLLLFAGCTHDTQDDNVNETLHTATVTPNENSPEPTPDISPTPAPKISSDFHDAPTADEINEVTDKDITQVLLQDMLIYEMPTGSSFAVALEEDASKQYRWLLASDDDKFTYIEEAHINGYRVFVFEAVKRGETTVLFELTQNTSTLVETLSYQLKFN